MMHSMDYYLALYFGAAVSTTLVVAMVICRHRIKRQKRISYGTMLLSPLIANVIVLTSFGGVIAGWDFFSPRFWNAGNWGAGLVLAPAVICVIPCIVPALAVCVYWRKRGKGAEI
jgi:hypothetical protein